MCLVKYVTPSLFVIIKLKYWSNANLSGASSLATPTSFGPSRSLQPCTASSRAKARASRGPLKYQDRVNYHCRDSTHMQKGVCTSFYKNLILICLHAYVYMHIQIHAHARNHTCQLSTKLLSEVCFYNAGMHAPSTHKCYGHEHAHTNACTHTQAH